MSEEQRTTLSALSDTDLRSLSLEQRHELIRRIAQLPAAHAGVHLDARRLRRHRLAFLTVCAVVLVPWTVYLGFTLPGRYVVNSWTLTWTGFDVILTMMFVVTGYLAFHRRQAVVVASFTSGVLLLCDAWFDVTTASGHDRLVAIGLAVFAELPVSAFLIYTALLLLRSALHAVRPDLRVSLWRLPILLADAEDRPQLNVSLPEAIARERSPDRRYGASGDPRPRLLNGNGA